MSIKTATTVAVVGVSIGLVMALASPFVPFLLGSNASTREQFAILFGFYSFTQHAATEGGLLVFLAVLAAKQKGQA
jgi:hypothetical protein